MKKILLTLFVSLLFFTGYGQDKIMDTSVYDIWNTVTDKSISNDGNWVVYTTEPHKGDGAIHIHNINNKKTYSFERGTNFTIDNDNAFVAFLITPHADTILHLRRNKVDSENFPKDTLAIYYFNEKKIEKIPNVTSFSMPTKWGGTVAYPMTPITAEIDSTAFANMPRPENETNGFRYIIRNSVNNNDISLPYCKQIVFSEKQGRLMYYSMGSDTINNPGVYLRDINDDKPTSVIEKQGEYSNFTFSESGSLLSFIANYDTTEAQITPYSVHLYSANSNNLKTVANNEGRFLKDGWIISGNKKPFFSENETRLIFGVKPMPILQDTNLLPEEIVQVEVWTSEDNLLYTQQENRLTSQRNKSYLSYYSIRDNKHVQLGDMQYDQVRLSEKGEGNYALGLDEKPYQQYISWLGFPFKNLALINMTTGEKEQIVKRLDGYPDWSPDGNFIHWYSRTQKMHKIYNVKKKKEYSLTDDAQVAFYNELHDQPSDPWPYGIASWLEDDSGILIYDRYDIWKFDPRGKSKPVRITKGREDKLRFRYISLDDELENLPLDTTILLYGFNEKNKSSGYYSLDMKTNTIEELLSGPYAYTRNIVKALDASNVIYTKENFDVYPDLVSTDITFGESHIISNVNPQQSEYGWGTIELVNWTGKQGNEMEGMIVKPPGFDPGKKYPLIVNFYERSSDRLHRHRAPFAHRSTINYSYYANQGYVIFNPDVHYTVGEPGQSALDAVMTGVDEILKEGYIDESKMGLQGHSWGGYQIAHILTKTHRFACAESGAPVVNMTSAYGGIRWRSGMSRMFQYEKTQSRLGATLWEKPDVYIKNSPLFELDKMQTPVLILHNDADGAVPWYQGIEYFVALRRLQKPAWLLNYNDEPHWPIKRQNRLDFNIRMQQFFDYYLKGSPMPKWMLQGVPAIEKGINQGLEYLEK